MKSGPGLLKLLSSNFLPLLVIAFLTIGTFTIVSQIDKPRDLGGFAAGGSKGRRTTTSVLVSPNPVPLNTSFTVSGSGFKANTPVFVGLSGYFDLKEIAADSTGKFSSTHTALTLPGTYTATALVETRKDRWEIVASISFVVR
ncbi:MAG: hypothetical protein Q7S03_04230 [bacterium]|nr:hypothetical protein [bacterium]